MTITESRQTHRAEQRSTAGETHSRQPERRSKRSIRAIAITAVALIGVSTAFLLSNLAPVQPKSTVPNYCLPGSNVPHPTLIQGPGKPDYDPCNQYQIPQQQQPVNTGRR